MPTSLDDPANEKITGSPILQVSTPYTGISLGRYWAEKRRLQIELLAIQRRIIETKGRLAITFDGRDAAGKGSTIRRFVENLMPRFCRVVDLGIPTRSESRNWLGRYRSLLPRPGEVVFFDRSWYGRALTEPTMGYCTKAQYRYFMNKVMDWEHNLIDKDLTLIKFYLSVEQDTQLIRFKERINDPLKFWKFSENDAKTINKWEVFTRYKNQMFTRTSSTKSPWVVINSNKKRECRLTCMLYVVQHLGIRRFKPLVEEDIKHKYSISIDGVQFSGLSPRQYAVLKELMDDDD